MLILFLILIVLALVILIANIAIVPQAYSYVVERLGVYYTTWEAGFHFKTPFVTRIAKKVSLKEQVVDFKPQPVITRDNVTMQIDTVVFFQITDPKLFTYGVERPLSAIENLSATTLRNIIGDMELDHTLTSRDTINTKITAILDEATDKWGIKVNRVEVKNIIPPAEIQDAMEKQMKAERQRRESILRAEGEKKSAILVAEGEKESAILRADAVREQRIREAEGEAQALMTVQKALADSIRLHAPRPFCTRNRFSLSSNAPKEEVFCCDRMDHCGRCRTVHRAGLRHGLRKSVPGHRLHHLGPAQNAEGPHRQGGRQNTVF